ncbi:MAG: hypothetical protein PHR68_00840 [Candidatus Gracilibacteria bacterium]|nr:hypothetical protein [Candidatus Gracilibacteria bacterium]
MFWNKFFPKKFCLSDYERLLVYPNKSSVDSKKTEFSHIYLTDKFTNAEKLIEYFKLNPENVLFFIQTNIEVTIPYKNPVAILNATDGDVTASLPNGLNFSTYLYKVAIPSDVYNYGIDMSDVDEFFGGSSIHKRSELNSVFYNFPNELMLFKSIFGDFETRKIPLNLRKFLLKLDVFDKDNIFFDLFLYSSSNFRENIKKFQFKIQEIFKTATEEKEVKKILGHMYEGDEEFKYSDDFEIIKILKHDLILNFLSKDFSGFKEIFLYEEKRCEFIKKYSLEDFFCKNFYYISHYSETISSFSVDSTKKHSKLSINLFKVFLNNLAELYSENLPFVSSSSSCLKKIISTKDKNNFDLFFKVINILNSLDNNEIISFVKLGSKMNLEEQLEKNTTVILVKKPYLDCQNEEITTKINKVYEEVLSDFLLKNKIEATLYYI